MAGCRQSFSQNTLEHGYAVLQAYSGWLSWLESPSDEQLTAQAPEWLIQNQKIIKISQLPIEVMKPYLIYHDCGKWACLTTDDLGRNHFPDHAVCSKIIWEQLFGPSTISSLIGRDMDMHTLKPSAISTYDKPELVPTLLMAALAELTANSQMFGGTDSTSYKIKHKALTRLGNAFFRNKSASKE